MQPSEVARPIQQGWRRWRAPLPDGGRRGWHLTLGVGLFFVAASLVFPMRSNLQARIAMTGFGAVSAMLVLTRPNFFWNNGRVEGWRWVFGDRGVIIIYLAVATVAIAFAWLYPL
jgi:hypothetical protein